MARMTDCWPTRTSREDGRIEVAIWVLSSGLSSCLAAEDGMAWSAFGDKAPLSCTGNPPGDARKWAPLHGVG